MEYYKQKYVYTCGPASVRMVLAELGIKKSRDWLVKKLSTNRRVGTRHASLVSLFENLKLDFRVHRNYKISDLSRLSNKGYYIIICYTPPAETFGHFAVFRRANSKFIFLHDPWFGPDFKIKRNTFRTHWKDNEGNSGWLIAVKKINSVRRTR